MPIWQTIPIEDDPEITLIAWQIYQTDKGERHFCGYNLAGQEGRVSSKIIEYDPEARVGRTRSGRVYRLEGETGRNDDADYVWSIWRKINKVESWESVNG